MNDVGGWGKKCLWEMDLSSIKGNVVVVDIDGTLLAHGGEKLVKESALAIEILRGDNDVFLFSNNVNCRRIKTLADELGVRYISSFWRKPNPLILRNIPISEHKKWIVIGDKLMTDGFFALFIGARFIKVRREKDGDESALVRLSYWFDDAFAFLARSIKRRT